MSITLAIAPISVAAPKPPPPLPLELVDLNAPPNVAEGLPYKAVLHRFQAGLFEGKNVTVFKYRYPNGQPGTFAIENLKLTTHSEKRMFEAARRARHRSRHGVARLHRA